MSMLAELRELLDYAPLPPADEWDWKENSLGSYFRKNVHSEQGRVEFIECLKKCILEQSKNYEHCCAVAIALRLNELRGTVLTAIDRFISAPLNPGKVREDQMLASFAYFDPEGILRRSKDVFRILQIGTHLNDFAIKHAIVRMLLVVNGFHGASTRDRMISELMSDAQQIAPRMKRLLVEAIEHCSSGWE